MSNALAIAATTATLRSLLLAGIALDPELADTQMTTLPPDKARTGTTNQINIFLYQSAPNPAWRNQPMTGIKSGETGYPPLPLNLYYMLSFYGRDNDDLNAHRLMGRAMSTLHDHPLLGSDEIRAATSAVLPDSDLHLQLERVRFTLQPVADEDIFKWWASFQTNYRLSVTYEAAAVLIESNRASKTPLPVLTRGGKDDTGFPAQPNLISPYPGIDDIVLPNQQTSLQPGDILTLKGHSLAGNTVRVQFSNPIVGTLPPVMPEAGATADEIKVKVGDDPTVWVSGFYTVAVIVSKTSEADRLTNEVPITLSPAILSIAPKSANRDGGSNVTLTIKTSPEVRPDQRASLLIGDRQVLAEPHTNQTDTLTFVVTDATPGPTFVRLRVDGVDSILIDRSGMPDKPPVFKPSQGVTIV